jgi:hypothetical protein
MIYLLEKINVREEKIAGVGGSGELFPSGGKDWIFLEHRFAVKRNQKSERETIGYKKSERETTNRHNVCVWWKVTDEQKWPENKRELS